jgi:phosphatidate cytidylyltransferase
MTDDRNNDQSGGGFDDWLDDEPGPATDPSKILASETDDESGAAEDVVDETAETEVVAASDDDGAEGGEDESDGLPDAAPEDEADDEDDTGELEVVQQSDQRSGNDGPSASDSEDTHEFGPVAEVGFGPLWSADDDDGGASSSEGSSPDLFDMTQEDYLHTATKEHAGLAESIAAADDEDTEQVALAAPIPGLDATVVGFEDVVEAEGLGRTRARASGDLIARIITAIVLIAALAASLLWQPALVAFAFAVFVLGAGEFYTALSRSGRKPIALFGFVGIAGASLGAYFGSALWIPLSFVLVVTALLLFYAVVPDRADPMSNLALTTTVMVWVGLGSFTMLIAKADSYRTLVLAVVVTVAAMDIAQYFFGRALGRHKLSPWVSPKKTVEGLVAGIIVAITIGALLHFFPPFEMTSGLALGVAVAIFAPLGDLAMSAAKRSLGLKDMGSVLPGHGGFLDRIDGLLFVIPVAWAIFVWAGIL